MPSESRATDIRQVPLADAKRAAASLAEYFTDDVVARYYLQISDYNRPLKPNEEKLNLWIYEYLTAAHCCNGLVVSAGPSHDCVGLWLPPDSDWNWKTYWKSGMWLLELFGGRYDQYHGTESFYRLDINRCGNEAALSEAMVCNKSDGIWACIGMYIFSSDCCHFILYTLSG